MMSFEELDAKTRGHMLAEFDAEEAAAIRIEGSVCQQPEGPRSLTTCAKRSRMETSNPSGMH
jgi:hypothetical protein